MQAPSSFRFLDLAAELREMVYDYVFMPPGSTSTTTAMDIFNQQVPHGAALRQTSKFVHDDAARIYDNAKKHFYTRRNEIQDDIISGFEAFIPAGKPEALMPPRAIKFISLARSLRKAPSCNHATTCPPQPNDSQCYFCTSPAHHNCFNCGKHLTIALYGHIQGLLADPDILTPKMRMQASPFTPPLLVLPSSPMLGERFTALGHAILKLPALPQTHLLPARNPATAVFNYYAVELKRQRAIELRCWIRKAAINRFWATEHGGMFCEKAICEIENRDKRMVRVKRNEGLWGKHEKMEWRGAFARRTAEEARMTGTHISWLVPV